MFKGRKQRAKKTVTKAPTRMNPSISPELSLIKDWKKLEKCPWCDYRPGGNPRTMQGSINAHVKNMAQKINNGHPDETGPIYTYFFKRRGMYKQSHDPEVQKEKRERSKRRAYDKVRGQKEFEKKRSTEEWYQVETVQKEIETLKY